MEQKKFYPILKESCNKQKKLLAILIDPDKFDETVIDMLQNQNNNNAISCFFVGGSLLTTGDLEHTIKRRLLGGF